MRTKKAVFVYPITVEEVKEGNNNYIRQLVSHLRREFKIVNGVTKIGLVDALRKFGQTDIYYFNWIENGPSKRFGFFQVILLALILAGCKAFNKKVVWFVHNNISHDKSRHRLKLFVAALMGKFADIVFSHSNEITVKVPKERLHVFHHPIEEHQLLDEATPFSYDMLIWGSVLPYKGVLQFVEFASASQSLTLAGDGLVLVRITRQPRLPHEKAGDDQHEAHRIRAGLAVIDPSGRMGGLVDRRRQNIDVSGKADESRHLERLERLHEDKKDQREEARQPHL